MSTTAEAGQEPEPPLTLREKRVCRLYGILIHLGITEEEANILQPHVQQLLERLLDRPQVWEVLTLDELAGWGMEGGAATVIAALLKRWAARAGTAAGAGPFPAKAVDVNMAYLVCMGGGDRTALERMKAYYPPTAHFISGVSLVMAAALYVVYAPQLLEWIALPIADGAWGVLQWVFVHLFVPIAILWAAFMCLKDFGKGFVQLTHEFAKVSALHQGFVKLLYAAVFVAALNCITTVLPARGKSNDVGMVLAVVSVLIGGIFLRLGWECLKAFAFDPATGVFVTACYLIGWFGQAGIRDNELPLYHSVPQRG